MDPNACGPHSIRDTSSAVDHSGIPRSPALPPSNTHRRLSSEDWPEEPRPSEGPSLRNDPSFSQPSAFLHLTHADPAADNADDDDDDDDDRTHLVGEAQPKVDPEWSTDLSADPERSAGFTSRPERQFATSSPFKDTIINAFRRASTRVADVQGDGPYTLLQQEDEHVDPALDGVGETTPHDAGENTANRPQPSTQLRGHALGFLGSTNPLRVRLYKFLIHPYAEPTVLALIIVFAVALVIQASRTLLLPDDKVPIAVRGYFHAWEDFVIFVLFIIFTIEALGRICLTGLLLDPEVSSSDLFSFSKLSRTMSTNSASHDNVSAPLSRSGSLRRGDTVRRAFDNVAKPFSLPQSSHARTPSSAPGPAGMPPSSPASHDQSHSENPAPPTFLSRIMKSDVADANPDVLISLPFSLDLRVARSKIERNIPYLRQGWGRVDFLALIGFWVSFVLATTGLERGTQHIGIFRALSVLRTARLLAVTNGTATIIRSLKIARPLLANVIYFIIFAMVLFSVIGVQSFKMSLRRSCILLPVLGGDPTRLDQTCGGHINATTLIPSPYLLSDGTPATVTKGFICPLGQVCQEGENPFHGVESFDTVYYAALQVLVLASGSTWARAMYQIIASEHIISCIFFIFGVLVLNFWLFNLLVAVIANAFSAIRVGTRKSAFGAAPLGRVAEASDEGWSSMTGHPVGQNRLRAWWSYTHWFWVALALATLVVQATANANLSAKHRQIIDTFEFIATLAFDVEIVVRIAVEFPAWRNFFLHFNNWLDLTVAIGCTIIQIPVIQNSSVYPWLTLFQLARFFRVLLVVPRMKPLMLTVFGNMYGLVNMTLFLMLITFLAALFAIQLIQGDMPGDAPLNFGQLFNSFLGVYQILSGENWTALLYDVTGAELSRGQPIIASTFLCCWLLFSNFIVMQMFIAVINENFEMVEEAKKRKQKEQQSRTTRIRWLSKLNPYRWFKKKSTPVKTVSPTSTLTLGEAEALVQHDTPATHLESNQRRASRSSNKSRHLRQGSLNLLHGLFVADDKSEDIPLHELQRTLSESRGPEDATEHERHPYLEVLARLKRTPSIPMEPEDIHTTETKQLIEAYPTYDRTLWIFPQTNPLRRFCQMIVRPSGGERINGDPPLDNALTLFQLVILFAVIGSVVTEGIATPFYRRIYYMEHGPTRAAWFHITDAVFGLILVVEFLIKIIADGFLLAPNAYIRSHWNILDFVIMVGVLVHVTFTLVLVSGLSRFVRALKALQALRLMTLIDKMRKAFEDLILAGFIRILDAALLAMLYLIPFSVWGTNIFAGLMNQCNDWGAKGLEDCTNEYVNTIHEKNFGFLVPRVWDHPSPSTTFSFDNFHSSLLILFEIVSQTGWVDVMAVAMSITGKDLQPQNNVSQVNAIFFVVYNLLGGVVVLTLFVSIIIGNFRSRTGAAYLTEAQREWIDLQKLIRRLKPSKRPKDPPKSGFRFWCYERAIHKHGWWTRMMTLLFVVQILVLMTQAFSAQTASDWHNIVSLIISFVYVVDVVVRFYGLGWRSFRANGWNLFDVLVASGSFTSTIFTRFYPNDFYTEFLQKLFLVSMSFKLVQRIAPLNQLFKTGTASLPDILNLLGLWLTLFLFFAIMYMEVFGLTKWYSAEDSYHNYQTMGKAFLMLVSLSTGEGWNQFMHDYTLSYPRCTQVPDGVFQTDCGSTAWAYTLFIAWNLLSMYIFLNLFTGVVVESFSYVFQSTGGVLKSITRHETRAFKKAWAQFSNPETRLLERRNLAPFLAKLDGVFEVRTYPAEHSGKSILASSKKDNTPTGVSLRKLNRELKKIDFDAIRKRREVYARVYHEANLMCWRREHKGIAFTEMLVLLAHHTLIDDEVALTRKELETRKAILGLVTDLVKLDRVRSHLRMRIVRGRYLQKRNAEAGTAGQGPGMPKPVVPTDMASPWSDSDDEEGWRPEHDSTGHTSSPVTLVARERTRDAEDLLDDPDIVRSPMRRRSEEMRLLQAEEEMDG